MASKDKCKELMKKFFGDASASQVDKMAADGMSDADITAKCRAKVAGFIGQDQAKEFD